MSTESPIEYGSHKLLYIEDNPGNRMLVQQLISRRTDLILSTAIDGSLGLIMARINQPELIMLDINLPDMSGYEVLTSLRADPRLAAIPVIALSSAAFPSDIEKGLQAGFFRYLPKPFRINELMDAIDDAMRLSNTIL
jgi:CheY-like chemotaxis protein